MRLTYIVLVASIFAFCEGVFAVSEPNTPQSNDKRLLRVHQDEEERTAPQLIKSLSEKLSKNTVEKLARGKSFDGLSKLDGMAPGKGGKTLGEVLKLDDVAYLKAGGKWKSTTTNLDDPAAIKAIKKENKVLFQHIESMGLNPDGMLAKMKQLGKDQVDLVLLKHYTKYWMKKYPTWTSSL